MTLDEFRAEFASEVAVWAAADATFTHSAFVDVAIRSLEDAQEVADFEPCFYRGVSGPRRRNVGVDGYAFDKADGSLRLFIANPVASDNAEPLTQTEAISLFGRLKAFVEDAIARRLEDVIDENSPARALADMLADRIRELSRIRAFLLTDAVLSSRVKDWPEGTISDIPIEFHIWDITRFFRAFSARSGRDDLVVDFTAILPGGIPCLEATSSVAPYSAYLCVLPGPALAEIYDLHGSRLLEGNVRAFLTVRGNVNKGIRNTVLHEPAMFFAYNNGIAATASSVEVFRSETGTRILNAVDLQIVNGAQTTATLSWARRAEKASLEGTFIPMKLSVVDPERSVEMIPKISRFANSQNKVSEADFFSNHKYHRRLEEISRRLWAPAKSGAQHETRWYYERARGQYVNETSILTASRRRRFEEMQPRDQVITKTDLAKFENTWRQLPHRVSRGAQNNFLEFAAFITERWNHDSDVFHDAYFRGCVSRAIIFKATERIVSAQSWYSGGYRANIVTYALAKLAHELDKNDKLALDFHSVWQRQTVSDAMAAQIALAAESVYAIITDPPAGQENVTQWCKREDCWHRVRTQSMPLHPDFLAELVPKEAVLVGSREAKTQQRVDSGIEAQTAVIQIGKKYWQDLLSWSRERGIVSPDDQKLLNMAAGSGSVVPTDRQSRKLLSLQKKLEEEGFRPIAPDGTD